MKLTQTFFIGSLIPSLRMCTLLCLMTIGHGILADDPAGDGSGHGASDDPLAGHSYHGEVFNEGPRQASYLMPGMGDLSFPITASDDLVQRLFNQGIAQLHGFWFYEAERSFRQAAVLDPESAMCYWGMTMANMNNLERARKFIVEAVKRKKDVTQREQMYIDALEAYCRDKDKDGKKIAKKDRAQRYTRDLEKIVLEYPEDIEAKAFLAVQLWENERNDLPIVSHVAVNALLQDIFDVAPMHPAHHYRIHLWDSTRAQMALESAAKCGQSLPGIAHMWHMPGHTYSKLHRYQDAVWQQEASARVDHAHMMRDRVLPDQIHNFAHNNEWLIRNLVKIGRVGDALDLAKNMLELPRHPKYNSLDRGSAKYGRERLMLVLSSYRLWPELIELADTVYFESTEKPALQIERLRHLGIALALSQQGERAQAIKQELEERLAKCNQEIEEAEAGLKQAKEPPTEKPEATEKPSQSEKPIQTETAPTVTGEGPTKEDTAKKDTAKEDTAGETTPSVAPTTEPPAVAGSEAAPAATEPITTPAQPTEEEKKQAEEEAKKAADEAKKAADEAKKKAAEESKRKQTEFENKLKDLKQSRTAIEQALAAVEASLAASRLEWTVALEKFEKAGNWDKLLKAEWLAESGELEKAIEIVDKEHNAAPGEILPLAVKAWLYLNAANTDNAKEPFQLLRAIAGAADLNTPMLARLAPLAAECGYEEHWSATLEVRTDTGERPSLDALGPFRWQPSAAPEFVALKPDGGTLSSSQLNGKPAIVIFYLGFGCLHCMEQLQEISPVAQQFRDAGVEIVAISSENVESLVTGLKNYPKKIDIPLHADPELTAFKAFRCFDDFEVQPLHGTFLIGADGRVLWQDISYEPFKNVDFLLSESHRLLELSGFKNSLQPVKQIPKLEEAAAK